MNYLLRRLGFYLGAGWTALTLNFFLPRLMPGDPATALFARFAGRLTPEALQALREAFQKTMRDPAFLAEAARASADIDPVTGEELQELTARVYKTPADVVARAVEAFKG